MIYRKAPPQPSRLLLRVVAVAGAGAVTGLVACSSSSAPSGEGFLQYPPDGGHDAGTDAFVGGGTVANPDSGVMGMVDGHAPADAQSDVVNGLVPNPDGGLDAEPGDAESDGSTEDVITGVVVNPDASGD